MNQDSSTAQLAEWLRGEVRRMAPGDRLPSTRSLTESRQVGPVTVSRALARDITALLPAVRFVPPVGGMHLWARLPPGSDDIEIAAAARRAGVIVMPGQPFFPAEAPAPHLRLTFSAVGSDADLHAGVQLLASSAPALAGRAQAPTP